MNPFRALRTKFNRWFRAYYENRVSIPWGIAQFMANVAYIQLNKEEYIELNPSSQRMGTIRLTTSDMRPMLTYKFWEEGKAWADDLREVQVIVELRGFQVKWKDQPANEWDLVVGIDTDPRIAVLKDLFISAAFYPGLRQEWKLSTMPLEAA